MPRWPLSLFLIGTGLAAYSTGRGAEPCITQGLQAFLGESPGFAFDDSNSSHETPEGLYATDKLVGAIDQFNSEAAAAGVPVTISTLDYHLGSNFVLASSLRSWLKSDANRLKLAIQKAQAARGTSSNLSDTDLLVASRYPLDDVESAFNGFIGRTVLSATHVREGFGKALASALGLGPQYKADALQDVYDDLTQWTENLQARALKLKPGDSSSPDFYKVLSDAMSQSTVISSVSTSSGFADLARKLAPQAQTVNQIRDRALAAIKSSGNADAAAGAMTDEHGNLILAKDESHANLLLNYGILDPHFTMDFWWVRDTDKTDVSDRTSRSLAKLLYKTDYKRDFFWVQQRDRSKPFDPNAVHVAINTRASTGEPLSMEIFVKDAHGEWHPLFFDREAGLWVRRNSINDKPVEAVCAQCHGIGPEAHRKLLPVPTFLRTRKDWENVGFKDPKTIDLMLGLNHP